MSFASSMSCPPRLLRPAYPLFTLKPLLTHTLQSFHQQLPITDFLPDFQCIVANLSANLLDRPPSPSSTAQRRCIMHRPTFKRQNQSARLQSCQHKTNSRRELYPIRIRATKDWGYPRIHLAICLRRVSAPAILVAMGRVSWQN